MKKSKKIILIITAVVGFIILSQVITMYNRYYPHIDAKGSTDTLDQFEENYQMSLDYLYLKIYRHSMYVFRCQNNIFSEKVKIGNKLSMKKENDDIQASHTYYVSEMEVPVTYAKEFSSLTGYMPTGTIIINQIEIEFEIYEEAEMSLYSYYVLYQFTYNELHYSGVASWMMKNKEAGTLKEYLGIDSYEELLINYLKYTYLFMKDGFE